MNQNTSEREPAAVPGSGLRTITRLVPWRAAAATVNTIMSGLGWDRGIPRWDGALREVGPADIHGREVVLFRKV
jgi:hypothetical protein